LQIDSTDRSEIETQPIHITKISLQCHDELGNWVRGHRDSGSKSNAMLENVGEPGEPETLGLGWRSRRGPKITILCQSPRSNVKHLETLSAGWLGVMVLLRVFPTNNFWSKEIRFCSLCPPFNYVSFHAEKSSSLCEVRKERKVRPCDDHVSCSHADWVLRPIYTETTDLGTRDARDLSSGAEAMSQRKTLVFRLPALPHDPLIPPCQSEHRLPVP